MRIVYFVSRSEILLLRVGSGTFEPTEDLGEGQRHGLELWKMGIKGKQKRKYLGNLEMIDGKSL